MITKDRILGLLSEPGTHRKQFSANSGVQKNKSRPTFSVPFDNGICRHFREGTGLSLAWNPRFAQHYCFLNDQSAIDTVEAWERAQGTRVFIKNAMSSSLALDLNFVDNTTGRKTRLGQIEEEAKHNQNPEAIAEMVEASLSTIQSISYLSACDTLLAVPAMPEKEFDLPRELAKKIALGIGKRDLTSDLALSGKTHSAKALELGQKWDMWACCSTKYSGPNLNGSRVLLVDDKYQSGLTLQFWAAKLLEFGAREVHGLTMVKTLRDTDNV